VNPYADIIDLPHHVLTRHPQMPLEKRASQFSLFAAMVDRDTAIQEIARLTEEQLELSENEKAVIDGKLQNDSGTHQGTAENNRNLFPAG